MEYEDIINLEHYELKYHSRMSKENRAAQFAPFSALTGYEEQVQETGRFTTKKKILDEDKIELINNNLLLIENNIKDNPLVSVIYFIKDSKKDGGRYIEYTDNIKKIDKINKELIFKSNIIIKINNIISINLI